MDGLRSFIKADNDSAMDVGGLRRGTVSVLVKKPLFSEAFPEAVIREGADELTLRADDKGIEGDDWEEPHYHYRELSQAAGAKKPNESQKKRKPFGQRKRPGTGLRNFNDPARKEDILDRTKTRLELWVEHLKVLTVALAIGLECLETAY